MNEKNVTKPKRIRRNQSLDYFFDIETSLDQNIYYPSKELTHDYLKTVNVVPYLIGLLKFKTKIKNYQLANYDDVINFQYFFNLTSFFDQIIAILKNLSQTNPRIKKINLWAHNISYDLSVINNEMVHYFAPYKKNSSYLTELWDEKKFFIHGQINLIVNNLTYTIVFKDSYRLFNGSLSSLVLFFDNQYLKKLSIDYDKFCVEKHNNQIIYQNKWGKKTTLDLNQEINYLKKDCLILGLFVTWFEKYYVLFEQKLVDLNLTKSWNQIINEYHDPMIVSKVKNNRLISISGYAKKTFYQFLMSNNFDVNQLMFSVSNQDYDYFVNTYLGGLTMFNPNLEDKIITGKIKYYDINSSYPNVMSKSLVYGDLLYKQPKKPHVKWIKVYYDDYLFKQQYRCFDNGLFKKKKEQGQWVIYCCQEFYDCLVSIGDFINFRVETYCYQLKSDVGYQFFNQLNQIKNDYKKTNPALAKMAKLTMNSIYGKLAEKNHEKNFVFAANQPWFEPVIDEKLDNKIISAGSYTTMIARVNLINGIKAVVDAGHQFLYCDTDSIIYQELNYHQPQLVFDDHLLGAWKLEGEYQTFHHNFVKKKYLLTDRQNNHKFAYSGLSKQIVKDLNTNPVLFTESVRFKHQKVVKVINHNNQTVLYHTDYDSDKNNDKIKWEVISYGQEKIIYQNDYWKKSNR